MVSWFRLDRLMPSKVHRPWVGKVGCWRSTISLHPSDPTVQQGNSGFVAILSFDLSARPVPDRLDALSCCVAWPVLWVSLPRQAGDNAVVKPLRHSQSVVGFRYIWRL